MIKNKEKIEKILFICTGNTCRSPLAMAYARTLQENLSINSKGISVFQTEKASENALKIAELYHLDLQNHLSANVTERELMDSNLILTMTLSHKLNIVHKFPQIKNKVFMLNEYALQSNKDISDPFGGNFETYHTTFLEIKKAIDKAFS